MYNLCNLILVTRIWSVFLVCLGTMFWIPSVTIYWLFCNLFRRSLVIHFYFNAKLSYYIKWEGRNVCDLIISSCTNHANCIRILHWYLLKSNCLHINELTFTTNDVWLIIDRIHPHRLVTLSAMKNRYHIKTFDTTKQNDTLGLT